MRYFDFIAANREQIAIAFQHETVIERQKSGGESRSSMMKHALRAYRYDYLLTGTEAQRCREYFDLESAEKVSIPDWSSPALIDHDEQGFALGNGQELILEWTEGIDFRCHQVYIIGNRQETGVFIDLQSYDADTGIMTLSRALTTEERANAMLSVFPVRIGRLSSIPDTSALDDEKIDFSLTFNETIESYRDDIDWTVSLDLQQFLGRPVLDFFWADGTERWQSAISYEREGFGQETGYQREDEAKRHFSLSVLQATRQEVHGLAKFFDESKGRAEGFWLSSDRCNYTLAQDAVAGATTITLKGAMLIGSDARVGYSHLMLRCPDARLPVKVLSVEEQASGDAIVTLSEPLSASFSADRAAVSLLNYVRFAADSLELLFTNDATAEASIAFLELPKEYENPSVISSPIYTYELTGYYNTNLTSYGGAIDLDGVTYEPANITHGSITQKRQSIKTSCSISLRLSAEDFNTGSHPLLVFRQGYPIEDIYAKIYKAEAATPSARAQVYGGSVKNINYSQAGLLKLEIGSAGDAAETEIPTAWFEQRCSRQFLAEGCNLNAADYTVAGTLSFSSPTILRADILQTEATSRGFDNWFLAGSIQIGQETRSIIRHNGDEIEVSSPFINASVGDDISVTAGCIRTASYCKDRFNNFENYGGFPFIPTENPQLAAIRVTASTPTVGKK